MKQKFTPATLIQSNEHNGTTINLKKINGLSVPYYAIDVLEQERNGARTLRTMTTKNKEMVYKVVSSLVEQLSNNVGFWDLKFSTN